MVASSNIVEVFKTSVTDVSQANQLVALLSQCFPGNRINFDLHDCDNILRVEGRKFDVAEIMTIVRENGFVCTILE
jgi:hypothetical protein